MPSGICHRTVALDPRATIEMHLGPRNVQVDRQQTGGADQEVVSEDRVNGPDWGAVGADQSVSDLDRGRLSHGASLPVRAPIVAASQRPDRERATVGVMDRWTNYGARVVGTLIGAFAGIVALQLMRLRRVEFLPGWPGFAVNHVVTPADGFAAGEPLNLVVLGDSTTAGVGVTRPEDALPYVLARRIADSERRPVRVISYGWAGARVADLPRQQVPRASVPESADDRGPFLSSADIVAIVIGSNDATHNTPPARYRAALRSTLESVRANAPAARLVLSGIPRFRGALRTFEPLIFLADRYAAVLRPISRAEAARVDAAYADLNARVPELIRGRIDMLASDGFHPSNALYSVWAQVIFEALVELPHHPVWLGAVETQPTGA